MSRKWIYRILTLTAVALIAGGCVLVYYLINIPSLDNVATISLKENESKTLKVDLSELYPGSKSEYKINIGYEYTDDMRLTMQFDGANDAGSLADYLTVSFSSESVEYQKSLAEAFSSPTAYDMGVGVKTITIDYSMSEDAGNETQGAYADFDLILRASRA